MKYAIATAMLLNASGALAEPPPPRKRTPIPTSAPTVPKPTTTRTETVKPVMLARATVKPREENPYEDVRSTTAVDERPLTVASLGDVIKKRTIAKAEVPEHMAPALQLAPAAPPEPKWYEAVELSAFVDAYAQLVHTGGAPAFRQYDARDGFVLNALGLNGALKPKPIGGTIQLRFGPMAAAHNPYDTDNALQYVKQAFASFKPNTWFEVDAGKFDQPFGAEGADSQANPNYSRGLLYSWGQPLHFTGVRVDAQPIKALDFKFIAANGWNRTLDANAGKTLAAQIALIPGDAATIFLGWADRSSRTRRW